MTLTGAENRNIDFNFTVTILTIQEIHSKVSDGYALPARYKQGLVWNVVMM